MSDFDKEAERERLREKYERDQEKRKATQHMSDLLLKGATMTNRHCGECGDPIFRYDGQEFCPTCQEVTAEGTETATDAEGEPAVDAEEATPGEEATATEADAEARTAGPDDAGADRPEGGRVVVNGQSDRADDRRSSAVGRGHEGEVGPPDEVRATGGEGIDEARASLVRTLNRFAREAESTSDPRRAREALAATREAAEALAALDRR